jgi:type IV pilus assembly protein PilW
MSSKRPRSAPGPRRSQLGLTLVEMAVAMAMALFLLSGVVAIVGGTRVTFGTQNQMAQLQDNERLAMTLMTDIIQSAGFFPHPELGNTATGTLPAGAPFAAAGVGLAGTSVAAGPDSITIRFANQSDVGAINCEGATTASAVPVPFVNAFSVNAQNQLQCQFNGGAQVALVNGVQNMMIWYGVPTGTASGQTCADSYLRASEVTAGGYWGSVCSVKVQLTFTNPNNPAQPLKFTRVISVMNTAGANT